MSEFTWTVQHPSTDSELAVIESIMQMLDGMLETDIDRKRVLDYLYNRYGFGELG